MFCSNCGKELRQDETYCSGCGTKVGAAKNGIVIDTNQLTQGAMTAINKGMHTLRDCKIYFFATVILLPAGLYWILQDMFTVSYQIFTTYEDTYPMFVDANFVKTIFILGYIAAAIALLLPLITGKKWENGHFKLAQWVPVAAVVWLVIVVLSAMGEAKSQLSGYEDLLRAMDLTVKLTSDAWLLLAGSAATVFCAHLSESVIMETQEYQERTEAQQMRQATPAQQQRIPTWKLTEMERENKQ